MPSHPVTEFISPSAWALIEDKFSPFAMETLAKLCEFMKTDVIPSRRVYAAQIPTDPATRWKTHIPILEELKVKAKKLGLWNLFLSKEHYPDVCTDLTNLEVGNHNCLVYLPCSEV
jgi:acyl-CoA dehydrogenase